MKPYQGKKLLVLGGKPIGSVELVQRSRELGAYVIVSDYLSPSESPAKNEADEAWDISTSEVDVLAEMCREHGVSGVLTAVHEFNINRMIDLCERLGYPCYCTRNTWKYCDNKLEFKSLCAQSGIPVAKKYDVDGRVCSGLVDLPYPVIVKPVDGSGSRGFHICNSPDELLIGYEDALKYSPNKAVIVEDYIPYDAVIIHYTMIDGRCCFSGMSDKYSSRFSSTGASVMGIQLFPSKGIASYMSKLNQSVIDMFEEAGFTDGPIWIEAFYDGNEKFVFNEMGYRFGGSLTYYPVEYFYGYNQLDMMLSVALGGQKQLLRKSLPKSSDKYCILPVHIHPGSISRIEGERELSAMNELYAYVPVHFIGDKIESWGSAQQVFCYLHITYNEISSLKKSVEKILQTIKAYNEAGENLLYTLFKIENL